LLKDVLRHTEIFCGTVQHFAGRQYVGDTDAPVLNSEFDGVPHFIKITLNSDGSYRVFAGKTTPDRQGRD
jgi:hypothetical protein